jgi:hypothetical protein
MDKIKHFYMERIVDVSGTSGTGIVARGVILPSGACVLEWLTFHSSIAIYKNIEDVEKIHGHSGATKVILGDPDEPKATRKRRTTRNSNKNSSSES